MSDQILETPGQKADAILAAIEAGEKCMVFCPYPIGWVAGVDMSQISIGVDRLNDVVMAVSAITGNLSFKVKQGD